MVKVSVLRVLSGVCGGEEVTPEADSVAECFFVGRHDADACAQELRVAFCHGEAAGVVG